MLQAAGCLLLQVMLLWLPCLYMNAAFYARQWFIRGKHRVSVEVNDFLHGRVCINLRLSHDLIGPLALPRRLFHEIIGVFTADGCPAPTFQCKPAELVGDP